MEQKPILTIRRNNKLVLRSMLPQYALRAFLRLSKLFDAFMVRTGRIEAEEAVKS